MEFVIGIDGGGTKTAAVILDLQGHLLGYGEGGPSTFGVVPRSVTLASIAVSARSAAVMAGAEACSFSAAFLGLGNVVSETDRAAVREIAQEVCLTKNGPIGVDHDIRVALAGGLAGRPGMVMIAGTGTSCYGVNAAGNSWRSGGWGPLIDDEGSSYWLGIQAMRAAVLAYDGRGEKTQLSKLLCERLVMDNMNDLMNHLYAKQMSRTQIAALAPLVFDAAGRGDEVAAGLIRRGCAAMAGCALAVARKLGMDAGASELAITGGLTNAGEALLSPFRAAVTDRLPQCRVVRSELIPAIGAALLALELLGIPVDAGVIDRVKKSGRAMKLVGEE